jgi:hypothetical protein
MRPSLAAAQPPRGTRPPTSRRRGARLGLALALAATATAACHRTKETPAARTAREQEERTAATLRQSSITVLRTGGIAGMETEATVDGSKLTYAVITRRACATGQSCPAPNDAASGAIPASAARDLFARVEGEGIFGLKEDYGTSPTLRDGYVYVVTLRRGNRTKTIRGDDSTQPPELARIEAAVLAAIDRARGR